MEDLWPSDIGYSAKRAPVVILREQASLLGQKTQNILQAEVEPQSGMSSGIKLKHTPFEYSFRVVAKALGNYRYNLFKIFHDIMLYPVEIQGDNDILKEVAGEGVDCILADSEDEFKAILKKILGSEKTREVIAALMSQGAAEDSY
jgi:hypothetical protein